MTTRDVPVSQISGSFSSVVGSQNALQPHDIGWGSHDIIGSSNKHDGNVHDVTERDLRRLGLTVGSEVDIVVKVVEAEGIQLLHDLRVVVHDLHGSVSSETVTPGIVSDITPVSPGGEPFINPAGDLLLNNIDVVFVTEGELKPVVVRSESLLVTSEINDNIGFIEVVESLGVDVVEDGIDPVGSLDKKQAGGVHSESRSQSNDLSNIGGEVGVVLGEG